MSRLYSDGCTVFGVLFPALFLIALGIISIVIYAAFSWVFREPIVCRAKRTLAQIVDSLATLATLIGSLQTIISLCIVGFSMWFGTMQVGTQAFALLIQGFASTGFGIAVAIIGRVFLQIFQPAAIVME